jgi:purine-binding chemotaxis protein CheW
MNTAETQGIKTYDQFVLFRIGNELFSSRIERVKEIIRYPTVTSIPRAPKFLSGIANLRGSILPIIDTRVMLGIEREDITESTRVLVIDTGDHQTGLIVDGVNGVFSLEDAVIEPPPPTIELEVDVKYVKNIIKRKDLDKLIMELDLDLITSFESSDKSEKSYRKSLISSKEGTIEESSRESINEIQLVTFIIGEEEYGFPIESVREVLRVGYLTEVPNTPSYVLGVLSVRNTLLPVIDLRKLFDLPSLGEDIRENLERLRREHELQVRDIVNSLTLGADITRYSFEECALRRWLEEFKTSSEDLARSIQSARYDHQELHRKMEEAGRLKDASSEEIDAFSKELNHFLERLNIDIEEIGSSIETAVKEDQKILVVQFKDLSVGFLVDRMQQVIRVQDKAIESPPAILSTDKTKNLKGIVKLDEGKRLILVLNEEKLINVGEIEEIREKTASSTGMEYVEETSTEEIQLITFNVGREEFGITIDHVREINRLDKITSIPRAPAFIKGVMNLRGNVIPIIDLRERFGLEEATSSEVRRVIIVEISEKLTGLLVDSVSEVLRLSKRDVESPPGIIETDVEMKFISGIGKADGGKRIILIIDADKILSSEEKEALKRTEEENTGDVDE